MLRQANKIFSNIFHWTNFIAGGEVKQTLCTKPPPLGSEEEADSVS